MQVFNTADCLFPRAIALFWRDTTETWKEICTCEGWADVCSEVFTELTCYRCGTRLEGTAFEKQPAPAPAPGVAEEQEQQRS